MSFTTKIRDSLVARITACRVVDRGSIPRRGDFFEFRHDNIFHQLIKILDPTIFKHLH
jgi:hypothetical protein